MLASRWSSRTLSRLGSRITKRTYSRSLDDRTRKELLALLLRNPELDKEAARNELRWILQEAGGSAPDISSPVGASGASASIEELVRRRAAGEPLQYVLGTTDFGPLTIRCRAPVLIPRPETAFIFERFARLLTTTPNHGGLRILDLCTGTGCIPLLLSHHLALDHSPLGVDFSPRAIGLARENAKALKRPLELLEADLFDPSFPSAVLANRSKFDILVSNPPYIPRAEYEQLDKSVREWEDPNALLDEPASGKVGDGLRFYRRIAELIPLLLRPSATSTSPWAEEVPRVVLEIGHVQAPDVSRILAEGSGGSDSRTEVWKDQYERDRAIAAWVS